MPDIFLSYAEEDRDIARRIASLLQAQGWSVRWEQPSSDDAQARCMVVLWSRHSVDSDQVAAEAEQGRTQHALVPVLLEQVTPPPGLRSIQAADLSGWDGAADAPGARQLVADLAELLGQPLPSGGVILPPVKVAPRLHPAWLILVALGLLLAAGLGAITLWRNAPAPKPAAAAATLLYAASNAASGAVQPTMPPWARIIASVAS